MGGIGARRALRGGYNASDLLCALLHARGEFARCRPAATAPHILALADGVCTSGPELIP